MVSTMIYVDTILMLGGSRRQMGWPDAYRGSEYKAAQLIAVANTHVQAAVGLAMAHAKPACIRTRAGQLFQTFVCHTLAALAIADAQRASGTAIEHAVISS